jgi:serine/threonine-protein kinase
MVAWSTFFLGGWAADLRRNRPQGHRAHRNANRSNIPRSNGADLLIGQKLGPYEILAKLGEGGMGEVYRATDTNLKRQVAIKVLPASLAADTDRLARFQREAEVLASLNHPNIAAIYGIEGRALIIELVEGDSPRGPLPFEDAWRIAAQIAGALEYAHDRGIVHRDLKPANVKVTPDGTVKLLDFGLAKAFNAPDAAVQYDPANSPTVTGATRAGVILGTAAYMSPEQAKGRAVDKRADIWAFGVVLYELLTGKRLFEGEDTSEILAAVLRHEPKLDDVPANSRKLLRACLEKDPRKRLRDIGDAQRLLDAAPPDASPTLVRKLTWPLFIAGAAALVVGLALIAKASWKTAAPLPDRPLMRLDADLGAELSRGDGAGPTLAISPDGKRLAFISAGSDGKDHLVVRLLDDARSTVLAETAGAQSPFFSPDSRWIGFFADGRLKKISVEGGTPVALANARNPRGGAWGENGNILFAPENRVGLSQISQFGGTAQTATVLDEKDGEISNRYPQLLPDGDTILFTARRGDQTWDGASIKVQSIKTGRRKTLIQGGYYGRYLPSGHLVYVHEGALMAAPMNLDRLEVSGDASPVIQDLGREAGNGFSKFDFTASGTFVYIAEQDSGDRWTVSTFDDAGTPKPLDVAAGPYTRGALAPDGERFAFWNSDGAGTHVFVYDLVQKRTFKLADFKGPIANDLTWTPDGKRVAFSTSIDQLAGPGIYWMRADAASEPQRLVEGARWLIGSFSPHQTQLAYWHTDRPYGLWTVSLDLTDPDHPHAGKPESLLPAATETRGPKISPDGRWMAYLSLESGKLESYVRPYPGPGRQRQISTEGADRVEWSPSARQLFTFALNGQLQVVDYTSTGEAFTASPPRLLWDKGPGIRNVLGIVPDGKHFVVTVPEASASIKRPTRVVFLLNFPDELRRRIPAVK